MNWARHSLSATACPSSCAITPDEARGLMEDKLRAVRRGTRLPLRGGGPARRTATPRPSWPPPLPARPDLRQPAAPGMAERMALGAPIQGSAADIIR
jgi:hypothetical protein